MSYARTALFLAALTALILAIGLALGGEGGMAIAFILALGMNLFAYWNSDKLVLGMYAARKLDSLFSTHPALANRARRLREMANAAGPWG